VRHWAVLTAVLLAGCATGAGPVKVSALREARHPYVVSAGTWRAEEGGLVNVFGPAPGGRGAVETLGLVEGFRARDFVLEGRVTFDASAVGGVVFRVQEAGGVIADMYTATFSAGGIDLWLLKRGTWMLLSRDVRPLASGRPYALRVEVQGDKMTLYLDGEPLLEARDSFLPDAGAVGLYAREGLCRFESVNVVSRDPKSKGEAQE
jgi:hypothetical protein